VVIVVVCATTTFFCRDGSLHDIRAGLRVIAVTGEALIDLVVDPDGRVAAR